MVHMITYHPAIAQVHTIHVDFRIGVHQRPRGMADDMATTTRDFATLLAQATFVIFHPTAVTQIFVRVSDRLNHHRDCTPDQPRDDRKWQQDCKENLNQEIAHAIAQ